MKGETCKYPYKAEPPCDFNPCTHEGCDAEDTRIRDVVTDISIHAPMKGATCRKRANKNWIRIAIHAPMKGATTKSRRQILYQSYFNPRTHEGCDADTAIVHVVDKDISIHAPMKGATPPPPPPPPSSPLFQSTHP